MLESVPSATAGRPAGIYCRQKSFYATAKLNKSTRASLALDSVFLFLPQFVLTEGKWERRFIYLDRKAILDVGLRKVGHIWACFVSGGQLLNTKTISEQEITRKVHLGHTEPPKPDANLLKQTIWWNTSHAVTHSCSDKAKTLPFLSLENTLRKSSCKKEPLCMNARNVLHIDPPMCKTLVTCISQEGKGNSQNNMTQCFCFSH